MYQRVVISFGFCAVLLVGALAATAADTTGEWRESLDGVWQFSTNSATGPWDALSVPGNWDTQARYSTYQGKGWYRREFVTPADWGQKAVRLRFEAVYHDAAVSLNGTELGTHVGGYTPFEFAVTDRLKPAGGTNILVVCADNQYRRGAWWHWGGISRSVALVANNPVRIVYQHVRTEPELPAGQATIFVRCKVQNQADSAFSGSLASTIGEQAFEAKVSVPARGETLVEMVTILPKEQVRLWHFDDPNLYTLRTHLRGGGQVMHTASTRFGIRKAEVTSDSLLLNGERVRLCGFNRVSDSREAGNTEPDELVRKDVDLMKRAGANLTRIMHYPQAPNLLDYLDEKGMLIWCEIPVWGSDDPQVRGTNYTLTRQWMSEMIERDYNHPCIIGWSVGNELSRHYDYVNAMLEHTRRLDPHRILVYVSNTGARQEYTPTNDPITLCDLVLYNTYSPDRKSAEILRSKWPEKAIFFSEFGIKQFGNDVSMTLPEGLEEFYRRETKPPYVIGVSLWTYNDYRSDYKGTPPSGDRAWGVVDVQRRLKAAYDQARGLFSPVREFRLEGRRITIAPRRPDEVPSYVLRGYAVRWKLLDRNGNVRESGAWRLPEMAPGGPSWSASLPATLSGPVVFELVTPTGYDVSSLEASVR